MYKYIRFFTIGCRMQWSSVKDDAELERLRASMTPDEQETFAADRAALDQPGGFVLVGSEVIVRASMPERHYVQTLLGFLDSVQARYPKALSDTARGIAVAIARETKSASFTGKGG